MLPILAPTFSYYLIVFLETKNSMIIAPNMCPFKEELIEQLNEVKKKEREIRMANFVAMETEPEEKKKNSTIPKLPFKQKWLLKETREDRYPKKHYKNVKFICKQTFFLYFVL